MLTLCRRLSANVSYGMLLSFVMGFHSFCPSKQCEVKCYASHQLLIFDWLSSDSHSSLQCTTTCYFLPLPPILFFWTRLSTYSYPYCGRWIRGFRCLEKRVIICHLTWEACNLPFSFCGNTFLGPNDIPYIMMRHVVNEIPPVALRNMRSDACTSMHENMPLSSPFLSALRIPLSPFITGPSLSHSE